MKLTPKEKRALLKAAERADEERRVHISAFSCSNVSECGGMRLRHKYIRFYAPQMDGNLWRELQEIEDPRERNEVRVLLILLFREVGEEL